MTQTFSRNRIRAGTKDTAQVGRSIDACDQPGVNVQHSVFSVVFLWERRTAPDWTPTLQTLDSVIQKSTSDFILYLFWFFLFLPSQYVCSRCLFILCRALFAVGSATSCNFTEDTFRTFRLKSFVPTQCDFHD